MAELMDEFDKKYPGVRALVTEINERLAKLPKETDHLKFLFLPEKPTLDQLSASDVRFAPGDKLPARLLLVIDICQFENKPKSDEVLVGRRHISVADFISACKTDDFEDGEIRPVRMIVPKYWDFYVPKGEIIEPGILGIDKNKEMYHYTSGGLWLR